MPRLFGLVPLHYLQPLVLTQLVLSHRPLLMMRNPDWDQWSVEPGDFYKQWTEEDLDRLVKNQSEEHPRLISAAKELMDYGEWGYTIIRDGDGWQEDWDNISDVPRACKWHPPQVVPSERVRNAHIRALAISASRPFPNIFRDPLARLQFIGQQLDEGGRGHGGLAGPCSWCGTLTGLWCDGVEPTIASFGWNCKVPICSWCRSVFSECRRCSVHTGIPLQMDPRANVQQCRVKPNRSTRRLLEFMEVLASELAVGTFHIVRAVEATAHLRLTCFSSYAGLYFPHIDKRYNIVTDLSSPEPSDHEDDDNSADFATTTSDVEQDESEGEMENREREERSGSPSLETVSSQSPEVLD